ncbi:MAG: hypothetical protein PHR92_10505 [Lachnospiraceae bacterium]|nr:hypothetical protein [Lachnospiraceae bacterium]
MIISDKQTFAVLISAGIFFPPEFVPAARKEILEAIEASGNNALLMPEDATGYGGIRTLEEGRRYAEFLKEHRDEYDGVIVSLPNFGDENSAILALRNCGVPILIQAYPDSIGKMDVKHRRDAFCGKLSIMNQFTQAKLPFTAFAPHTIFPEDPEFIKQLQKFAGICRVVKGMKSVRAGAIGARTTPWKTVRVDEIALESMGITVETIDLSDVFEKIRTVSETEPDYLKKLEDYRNYADWGEIPSESFRTIVKTAVIFDRIIDYYQLDCLGIRCWNEFEAYLKICPCVILGELNNRGIPAACEVDIANALSMYALQLASMQPTVTLDWNNNYNSEENKCILFHCGPVPRAMLTQKQKIVDNPLQAMVHGPDCSWGSSMARIAPSPMTYMSACTENGRLRFYMGEGKFTGEVIDEDYFGNAGVAEIPNLQNVLLKAGSNGFKHHVSVTCDTVEEILREAFTKYLDFDIIT